MSAATLYQALLDTVEQQTQLDDPLSPIEIIGALEMVKHDMLTAFDDDDLEDDCGCDDTACAA